jgi:hypothetical protein
MNRLPDVCQFVFQLVLARDYLIFHSFLCLTEESKVKRWWIWWANWMRNPRYCLSGKILSNLAAIMGYRLVPVRGQLVFANSPFGVRIFLG